MPEKFGPRFFWVPEHTGSHGDEAIDLARMAGRDLDEKQCDSVVAMLSYGKGGKWAAREQVTIESRQNGKTAAEILPVVMYDLWMCPPGKIIWTAHLFDTTRETFEDLDRMIGATPVLSKRVKNIAYGHGEEEIELHSGAVLEFKARSTGGGRGKGAKRIVFDEAGILAPATLGAFVPALSAQPDTQLTYGASAGLLGSAHLRALRARGRAMNDPSLVYIEQTDDGTWEDPPCALGLDCTHLYGRVEGCALDDETRWARGNHSLGLVRANGTGISLETVRAERRTLGHIPVEFGRERLGWWEDPPDADGDIPPIDLDRWAALSDAQAPQPTGDVALVVEVPNDRSSTSIAAAWWDADRVMVMVTEIPGTTRAPSVVKGLVDKSDVVDVSLHAGRPAGALLERLELEGVEVRTVSAQEDAQATGAFLDLVTPPVDEHGRRTDQKLMGHLDQPALNRQVAAARTKETAPGAKVWVAPDDLTSIAALRAVTLAAHGLVKHSKPPSPFFGAWR